MEAVKDSSHLYEVERRARHAERPGFRISELQIGPRQQVPWHYHNNVQDTFYVLEGRLRLFLREPKEDVRLEPGETYTVRARRPASRHECGRRLGGVPGAAGPRRVRLRSADLIASMRGWTLLIVTLLVGAGLGAAGTVYLPPMVDPYLPKELRIRARVVEGLVLQQAARAATACW